MVKTIIFLSLIMGSSFSKLFLAFHVMVDEGVYQLLPRSDVFTVGVKKGGKSI